MNIVVEILVVAVMTIIVFMLPEDILTRMVIAYAIMTLIYYIGYKGWEK